MPCDDRGRSCADSASSSAPRPAPRLPGTTKPHEPSRRPSEIDSIPPQRNKFPASHYRSSLRGGRTRRRGSSRRTEGTDSARRATITSSPAPDHAPPPCSAHSQASQRCVPRDPCVLRRAASCPAACARDAPSSSTTDDHRLRRLSAARHRACRGRRPEVCNCASRGAPLAVRPWQGSNLRHTV
jgi:hypothetical protein